MYEYNILYVYAKVMIRVSYYCVSAFKIHQGDTTYVDYTSVRENDTDI